MKILNFHSRRIALLETKNPDKTEKVYASLAEEFVLSVITISNEDIYHKSNLLSAEMLLCTEGEAQLENNGSQHSVPIKQGDSAIVFAAAGSYRIRGNAVLFKAAVPP